MCPRRKQWRDLWKFQVAVRAGRWARSLVLIMAIVLVSAVWIGTEPGSLVPQSGSARLLMRFFGAAFRPALDYQQQWGDAPLLRDVLVGCGWSLLYAAAGIALALLFSVPLVWARVLRIPLVSPLCAALSAVIRSVHELVWAVIFLAAIGFSPLAAICAIALPYAGGFARVFVELMAEADARSEACLRRSGARTSHAVLFGRLPHAWPDIFSYTLYNLECAVRSATIMGFFGLPTLGYLMIQALDNLHYNELWTCLYALVLLVLAVEHVGRLLRRRGASGSLFARMRMLFWAALAASPVAVIILNHGISSKSLADALNFLHRALTMHASLPMGAMVRALADTLAIATLAIFGAVLVGTMLGMGVAQVQTTLHRPIFPFFVLLSKALKAALRALLAVLRAVPIFLWAFLLVGIYGSIAIAAVLALALNFTGILGRLVSDVIEETPARTSDFARAAGAGFWQALLVVLVPQVMVRLVVHYCYRWESAAKEAIALGLLGFTTLGYWIYIEAWPRLDYGLMLFCLLIAALLAIIVEEVSAHLRRVLRVECAPLRR